MLKLNKSTMYFFIIASLFSTYSKIYPTFSHESGGDSPFYHSFATFLLEYGTAYWLMDTLSYFGLYPFSAPSGALFLLASVSTIIGLDTEICILILNYYFVTIGTLSCFLLGRKLSRNDIFTIFLVITFINSYYLLKWNNWNFSIRGPFICIMPLFVYQVLSFSTNRELPLRSFSIIFLLYFILATTHRMSSQIIPFVIIPFFISYYFIIVLQRARYNFENNIALSFKIFLILLSVSMVILSSSFDYNFYSFFMDSIPGQRFVRSFPSSLDWIDNKVLNLFYAYALYVTPLASFAVIGFFGLILKTGYYFKARVKEIQILSSMFVFIPLLVGVEYTAPVILVFIAIFTASGIVFFNRTIRNFVPNKKLPILFISLIILTNASSSYVLHINNKPNNDEYGYSTTRDWTSSEEMNTGAWLSVSIGEDERFVFDDLISRNRLAAYYAIKNAGDKNIVMSENATPFSIIDRLEWVEVFTYQTGSGGFGGTYISSFTGESGFSCEDLVLYFPRDIQTGRATKYFSIEYAVLSNNPSDEILDMQEKYPDNIASSNDRYSIYMDSQLRVIVI